MLTFSPFESRVFVSEILSIIKPHPKINRIGLLLGSDKVQLMLFYSDGSFTRINYFSDSGGCRVQKKGVMRCFKYMNNVAFSDLLRQDLKMIKTSIDNHNLELVEFSIIFQEDALPTFQSSIALSLLEQPPLRIKFLNLSYKGQPTPIEVLPFVLPKKLTIKAARNQQDVIDLEPLAELAQFRNLQKLRIQGYRVNNARHFIYSDTWISMNMILPEYAVLLKETFRNSPTFKSCHIVLDNTDNIVEVLRAIIPNVEEDVRQGVGYFTTATPEKLLRVYFVGTLLFFGAVDIANMVEWVAVVE